MAVEAVGGPRTDIVPGVPSRLPALAAEVFGTFVLVLSGTATLLATARIGHGSVPGVMAQIAVAVAFGFGILAAVYTVATVSGRTSTRRSPSGWPPRGSSPGGWSRPTAAPSCWAASWPP